MFSSEIRPLGQFLFVCLFIPFFVVSFVPYPKDVKKIGMMNVRWPDAIHQHI